MSTPNRPPAAAIEGSHDWQLEVQHPIEPGVYAAQVESVLLKIADDGREWLAWQFQLDDGRTIGGGTSYSIGVRSKAYAWLGAILGRAALGGGAQVTEVDVLHAPCRIVVELDADDLSKVSSVLPPEAAK